MCYNVLVLFYTTLFYFFSQSSGNSTHFFPGALLFFENVIIQKNKVYISSMLDSLSHTMLSIPYFLCHYL